MEDKEFPSDCTDTFFNLTLKKAKQGDKTSLKKVIDCLMPDIEKSAHWIWLPKEDAIQAIIVELIDFIKNTHF